MPHRPKVLYRDHLIQRIPEAFQDYTDLEDYIRVCGEIFDDASDQIKLHDWYEDYRRTPEERLGVLINKYGIDITRTLPEEIIRAIVRDIHSIYTSNGTEEAFRWVFRLLKIEYKIEKAWLIDPHLYFNDIGFENNSPFDRPEEREVLLPIGTDSSDSYIMGKDAQRWLPDKSFRIIGIPKIGYNTIIDDSAVSTGDSVLDEALRQRSFNYNEFDYKNFVYGDSVDQPNGTYFYGRSFNSNTENIQELRIIGENYDIDGAVRKKLNVMATPYILLTISEEDFSRFINSYETDSGDEYSLSPSDKARLIEYLFGYLLLEVVKPSTVVILSIAQTIDLGEYSGDDDVVIATDSLTMTRVANIPDAMPTASFVCLLEATDAEITVTWNEMTGVDGYRVYGSTTPFDETSLPATPLQEISGYETTEFKMNASNNSQYYFAVEPFIAEGSTVSSLAYVDVQGCVDFAEFSLTGTGVCKFPVDEFSITTATLSC